MKDFNVLLVNNDTGFADTVHNCLKTKSGIRCVDVLEDFSHLYISKDTAYDYVIVDTDSADNDCSFSTFMNVAAILRETSAHLICIVNNDNALLKKYACSLGAEKYFTKPVDIDALYDQMARTISIESAQRNLGMNHFEREVTNMLLTIGIPPQVEGFKYLRHAVLLTCENPDLLHAISKKLYPTVAAATNSTVAKVDRAIRHAVELSYLSTKYLKLNEILGCTVFDIHDRPTSSGIIGLLVEHFKLTIAANPNDDCKDEE